MLKQIMARVECRASGLLKAEAARWPSENDRWAIVLLMISFAEAKQIALAHIGPDCALMEDQTLSKSWGWYFAYQSKSYLQSAKETDMLIGSGGFVVGITDGRIFEFGSAFTLERNLRVYEAGYRFNTYDLTVIRIQDIAQTIKFLRRLRLAYVKPEEAHGVEWKIPRDYAERELREILTSLPQTFSNQNFYFVIETLEEMKAAKCCDYELSEHIGTQ